MDTVELRKMWEGYKAARHRIAGTQPPTSKHRRIAEMVRNGKATKDVAKATNSKVSQVHYAIKRVAIYDFYNANK